MPSPRVPEMDMDTLASTPSFRKNSDEVWPWEEDPSLAEVLASDAAAQPVDGNDDVDDDDEEFEFAAVSADAFDGLEPVTADEIFPDGRIRPVYPLFSRGLLLDDDDDAAAGGDAVRLPLRKLMIDDSREPPSTSSSSSAAAAASESDELERIPAESYCVWVPRSEPASPDHLRKRSHSTGNSSCRRWRLRDLVIGRSHSDGRKRFVFLAAPPQRAAGEATEKAGKKQSTGVQPKATGEKKVKGRVVELDMVTAHRLYYGKGAVAEDRRRSFLPYRKELVGFHLF